MTKRKKTTKKTVTKRTAGQPTKYKPEYVQKVVEFFDVEPFREITKLNKKTETEYTEIIANSLPTLVGFAAHIGVSRAVLQCWAKAHPEFLYAVTCAKAKCEQMLVTNALEGLYNPQFSQFVAKNYTDMRDVKELKIGEADVEPQTVDELRDEIEDLDRRIAEAEERL